MDNITKEISGEEYAEYKKDPAAYRRKRRDEVPDIWVCAYGYYGCDCYEQGGRFYRVDHIGSFCD